MATEYIWKRWNSNSWKPPRNRRVRRIPSFCLLPSGRLPGSTLSCRCRVPLKLRLRLALRRLEHYNHLDLYSFAGGCRNLVVRLPAFRPSISVLLMTTRALLRLPALGILLTPVLLHAAEAAPAPSWHAQSLGQALLYMLLFAGVGIVAAIAGYKIFDKCTPGHLNTEILEHRNVAAAIIAASVILGVCIIIAASMLG
jgi:putative membrane protein